MYGSANGGIALSYDPDANGLLQPIYVATLDRVFSLISQDFNVVHRDVPEAESLVADALVAPAITAYASAGMPVASDEQVLSPHHPFWRIETGHPLA